MAGSEGEGGQRVGPPIEDRLGGPQAVDRRAVRLDKFLQVSRLVKRRTLADALCSNHRVRVNDHVAKASTAVRAGDIIEIDFGTRRVTARVLKVPDGAPPKSEAALLTEIVDRSRVREAW
ncbi:MAG: RNA-binding S4 domain-containing protein [Armatimonadota bacterium]|nr:RNA-binding S4 domain-containing protein [Armatimonadota bacterium]MDR5697926.1 RNA-binding S4 domain-containing protein [Armatimonadota bacterium]